VRAREVESEKIEREEREKRQRENTCVWERKRDRMRERAKERDREKEEKRESEERDICERGGKKRERESYICDMPCT